MKIKTTDFKKHLRAVRRIARTSGADRALIGLKQMLKTWPDHPILLLEKSRLIQLSERANSPTPNER